MTKKIIKLMSNILGSIAFFVLCIILFITFASRLSGNEPALFGYQMKTVLSGSMEPTFLTGSIITIKKEQNTESFQRGDIITFHIDNKLVTHRIVEVMKQKNGVSYKTKGDNNSRKDLWSIHPQDVVGKYTGFTVPYIGYLLSATQSKEGTSLLLIIPGIALVISAFRNKEPVVKETH